VVESDASSQASNGARVSPVSALWGVLLEPRKTFEGLKSKRAWWLALIVVMVFVVAFNYISTPYALEAQIEKIRLDPELTAEQKDQQLAAVEIGRQYVWVQYAVTPIFGLVFMLIFAGILLMLGNVVLGGDGTYNGFLTVGAYSSMVGIPEYVIKGALVWMKKSIDVSTSLGLVMPGESEGFLYHLLDGVDIFGIWTAYLVAVGISVFAKVNQPKAIKGVFVFWALWVLGKAIFKSTIGTSFLFGG
jgi:hypothetical protein